ncbi:MAG: hypothetical protein ABI906_10100, partial [Pseudomonadota bacterium]
MTRLFTAAALAMAVASPAAAQVAGVYSGTSADGDGVSFTVSSDGSGGFAVTSATVFFGGLCKDTSPFFTGWGYGLNQPIVNRKVSDSTANASFTINFNLTFSSDAQTATGAITSYGSTLSPIGPKPKKALICTSPKQAMGVSFQPGAARVSPPAGGSIMYGKPSHAT